MREQMATVLKRSVGARREVTGLHKTSQLSLVSLAILLGGCAGTPRSDSDPAAAGTAIFRAPGDGPGHQRLVESAREQIPRELPKSRYGNPKVYEVLGKTYETLESASGYKEQGNASWYGRKFHGRLTSSREVYDMYQLTAAHRSLPIPTFVEITNLNNGKSIIAKVNDRGPFHHDRIIDLSYAAAVKLDMINHGTAPVEVRAIDPVGEYATLATTTNTSVVAPNNASRTAADQPSATAVETAARPSGDGVYVQLGAFSQMQNAETMRNKVLQIIPAAAVNILPSAGRGLYHVQLGPLRSRELIGEVLAELNRAGVTSYHLVSY